MMNRHWFAPAAVLVVATAWLSATSLASSTTRLTVTPVIERVSPASPAPGSTPQRLSFEGRDFRPALELEVLAPDGQTTVMAGNDILDLELTHFAAMVTLAQPGSWTFTVRNTDGGVSEPFVVTVKEEPVPPPAPVIAGTDPEHLQPMPRPQTIRVSGDHFAAGLRASVTDDAGQQVTDVTVSEVAPQQVVLDVRLDRPGEYSLVVTNPSGAVSNAWPLTVR